MGHDEFMGKNKAGIVMAIIGILFLGGCTFSDSKKTEIDLKENEIANIQKEGEGTTEEGGETAENTTEDEKQDDQVLLENNPTKDSENEKEDKTEESPKPASFKLTDKLVSWGYAAASGRKIDTIVIHSSYNSLGGDEYSLEKILDIYKSYGVSPHYIIARDGKVYRLVADKNIAYHAGVSSVSDGRENVNNFSIGIEIINTKTEGPSPAQYSSLKKLVAYLKDEYKIKYTLGHSDIAPGRKDDPWKFNWEKVK